MSIREHIKSAMQGDVRSFEYLVNNFQAYTINYAYGILGDYHLAEDAAQEAFILLYGNIGNLKEPSAFLSWLNRLTFTCCGRITRKKKLDTNNGFEGLRSAENPAGAIETEERLSLIRYSLNDLTEVQREAITLYYFMDKSYSDIGELLGISEAAVKNRLYAGKKRLRDILPKTMKEYVEEIMSNREQFTRKILEQVPNITTQDPKIHENFQFCGCMRG